MFQVGDYDLVALVVLFGQAVPDPAIAERHQPGLDSKHNLLDMVKQSLLLKPKHGLLLRTDLGLHPQLLDADRKHPNESLLDFRALALDGLEAGGFEGKLIGL